MNIKGIDIPKDLAISVDVLSIHFDQDIWGPVDPNTFYPVRFSPEIKRPAAAFLGFGLGPRNCVGMKFAIFEIKIALVKILMKFEILPGKRLSDQLELAEGATRRPKYGVDVILRKR